MKSIEIGVALQIIMVFLMQTHVTLPNKSLFKLYLILGVRIEYLICQI